MSDKELELLGRLKDMEAECLRLRLMYEELLLRPGHELEELRKRVDWHREQARCLYEENMLIRERCDIYRHHIESGCKCPLPPRHSTKGEDV